MIRTEGEFQMVIGEGVEGIGKGTVPKCGCAGGIPMRHSNCSRRVPMGNPLRRNGIVLFRLGILGNAHIFTGLVVCILSNLSIPVYLFRGAATCKHEQSGERKNFIMCKHPEYLSETTCFLNNVLVGGPLNYLAVCRQDFSVPSGANVRRRYCRGNSEVS
jgi:hypothetical protein